MRLRLRLPYDRFGRVTLRTQFLVALGLLAAFPIVLFGLATSRAAEDTEVARADREAVLASTSLARELGRMMEGHIEVVSSLASEVDSMAVIDKTTLSERTRHYMSVFPGVYCTFFVDVRGVTVEGTLSTEGGSRPMDGTVYSDRRWFQQIREGVLVSAELLRSRTTGRPAVILAVPTRVGGPLNVALAGVGVDLGAVQHALERVTEAAPGLASVVLDESGRVVAAGGNRPWTHLDHLSRLPLYRRAAGHASEPRIGKDEKGELRRGTVTEVESTVLHWSVTTTWSQAVVRQRGLHAIETMAVFALGALAVGLGVAFVLARALAQPVIELSGRIEGISRGDLRVPSANSSRPWHPRELVDLSAAINRMLAHLQGVMKQIGRTAVAVRGVTERLHETSENMLAHSRTQREAVLKSAGAIVQITGSMANVGGSVRGLSETAANNTHAILILDRQIDQIAQSLRTLAKTIASTLVHVEESERQVGAVADSSVLLGATVEKTNSSLRLLSDSIGGVAQRADHSRALGREALAAAEAGRAAVDQTIGATREIQHSFSAVGAAVNALASRSEAIGEVASVIEGVMHAARLLGLNASIIASDAGEHGKRFGVVADRVRAMAAETADSIETITQLVGSVQFDIRKAVEAVRHGQLTVQAGERCSADAEVRLRAIIGSSGDAERTVQEIADATRDQATRVRAVLDALNEVRQATGRIERAVETQRRAQQDMGSAIAQVRTVGDDVRISTEAQQSQSQAMTAAVRAMTHRLLVIAQAIEAQNRERDRIEGTLGVFEGASNSTVEFAQQLGDVVRTLSDRLERLEQELSAFRID